MGTILTAAPRRPRPTVAIAAGWAAALVAVAVVGALGSDTSSTWYRELDRPSWQPPGAVFGPVWTTLYVLIAIAATLATRSAPARRRGLVVGLLAANLVLNVGWTWIFFRAHAPVAAGVEIVVLLATIVALIRVIAPHHRGAALLLVPYLAWVSFATVLTWTIAATN
ncbi:TspO/MBR family protein [Patulibacter brassicae]|uniref:TspO/MBR family protein n=1 Tax=Patulibacter brassicae TaxID=1705717 RepID=A0ABU4VHF4_9ACTN|nr:TspO/MBR family protein [Patulibacter brassicae]MDX8151256.1 TspO/MBR family protein [Patulibacter brassicae]